MAPPPAPSPLQGQSTGPGVDCCWPAEPVKENKTLILVLELLEFRATVAGAFFFATQLLIQISPLFSVASIWHNPWPFDPLDSGLRNRWLMIGDVFAILTLNLLQSPYGLFKQIKNNTFSYLLRSNDEAKAKPVSNWVQYYLNPANTVRMQNHVTPDCIGDPLRALNVWTVAVCSDMHRSDVSLAPVSIYIAISTETSTPAVNITSE